MKKLSPIFLLFVSISISYSQQYNTALGIKADYSSVNLGLAELSVKHFFTEQDAFEINAGAGQRFFWFQAMYLRSQPMVKEFDWYFGGGVDAGHWSKTSGGREGVPKQQGFWTGINGAIGIEYTFDVVPINLALDTGPTFRIVPELKFGWNAAIAFRYAFRKRIRR
jgi:hypothetical protein